MRNGSAGPPTERQRAAIAAATPARIRERAKLEYFFGNATGMAHNIERSQEMLASLSRIGIRDNAEGRALLENFLQSQFADDSSIRDGLLIGPGGFAKMETIWRGPKLVTGFIFSGG
jgi:hypothetical protein